MLEGKNNKNKLEFEIERMQTNNTSFSIDQLGKQCGKLQYIRELTQNSIEAIMNESGEGNIFWTFDRDELNENGHYKLCIIDNGPSMTGEDLRKLMNQMYSSGKNQSIDGNFGIGAKVAGLYRSPKGLIYKCYKKEGVGILGEFVRRDSDGEYGLREQDQEDGSTSPYLEIPYFTKPKQMDESGTMVTLIGREEDEDTFTSPPEGEQGKEWLSRYLNGRYYSLPEKISLKVTYRNNPNQLESANYKRRTIKGMKYFLDKYQVASGLVEVSGAKMHWWVLDEDFRKQNYFLNSSHTGSLYQKEIFDLEINSRTNRSRLNRCGIIHLMNRIVIYAEPTNDDVFADPSRTELLVEQGVKTPWYSYADQFSQKLPQEIAKLEEEASEKASDADLNIRAYDILKKWLKDFDIPKFSKKEDGEIELSPPIDEGGSPDSGTTSEEENKTLDENKSSSGPRGRRYSDFIKDGGVKGRDAPSSSFIPKVDWVKPENHPHLEDRAAQYIREHNRILINEEFRGLTHLIEDVFKEKGGGKIGSKSIIEDECKLGWMIHLSETVMRVQMLKRGGKTWKQTAIDSALSEEALTASVSGVGYLNKAIKNTVALKIGRVINKKEEELLVP